MGGASSGAGDGGGADVVTDRHGAQFKVAPKRKKNIIERTGAGEVIGNIAAKHNTWRRERYIKKHKLENKMSSMDPAYIVSPAGRKELDRVSKGDYQKSITAPRDDTPHEDGGQPGVKSETSILGSETKIQKDAVKKSPDGPAISEMAQLHETEAERLLKIKRKGRKKTKLLKDTEDLTLSKKVLLG